MFEKEKEILAELGVLGEGKPDEANFYEVTIIEGLDEFSKVHSLLNKSDKLELEESDITEQSLKITYIYGENEYVIIIESNLETDKAIIKIKKLNKEKTETKED